MARFCFPSIFKLLFKMFLPAIQSAEDFDYGRVQPSTRSIKSQEESRGWLVQYSHHLP